MVDENSLGVAVAENDILENGHGLHQHKVLVHHADAQLDGLGRGLNADRFPMEVDGTLRGLIQTEQHVHQRAFTGAVFAQKRVHFAFAYIEIDVSVGIDVTEFFGDVLHAQ